MMGTLLDNELIYRRKFNIENLKKKNCQILWNFLLNKRCENDQSRTRAY